MSAIQSLYGYQLIDPIDGTCSRWYFNDDNSIPYIVFIKSNGARLIFQDDIGRLADWARNRELQVKFACFNFDPNTLTFTRAKP